MTIRFKTRLVSIIACTLVISMPGTASAQNAIPNGKKSQHAAPPVPVETAALRITCEGKNAKAEVSINGVLKGECPFDASVPAGLVTVKATKKLNNVWELVYLEQFRLGADIAKRVEIVLNSHQFRSDAVSRMDATVEALLSAKENQQRSELPALEAAANNGAPAAMRRLGTIYKFGLAGPVDIKLAAMWFERGAKARDPESMFEFAMCNWEGLGVPINESLAAELLRASAQAGNPEAMKEVAWSMELGQLGFQKDLKLMADYLEKASRAGVENADSMWQLTEMKLKPVDEDAISNRRDQFREIIRNTSRKLAEGLEDFDAASNAAAYYNVNRRSAELEQELGLKYSRMAMRYKKKAAASGVAPFLRALGLEYELGYNTPKDLVTAERLYRQAAALGDKKAAANLAKIGM